LANHATYIHVSGDLPRSSLPLHSPPPHLYLYPYRHLCLCLCLYLYLRTLASTIRCRARLRYRQCPEIRGATRQTRGTASRLNLARIYSRDESVLGPWSPPSLVLPSGDESSKTRRHRLTGREYITNSRR